MAAVLWNAGTVTEITRYGSHMLHYFFRKHKNIFTFPIISHHWDDAAIWNPSSWKTMTCIFYIFNSMAADDLARQGARASTAMILTSFLTTEMTQVFEILPHKRQAPVYSTYSIEWLLMTWRRKEPGHQQLWYWPRLPWIIQAHTAKID